MFIVRMTTLPSFPDTTGNLRQQQIPTFVRMTKGRENDYIPVIPRHYWESKTTADPHFREDDERA